MRARRRPSSTGSACSGIAYDGVLNERSAIESLRATNGGVNGLLGMAETLRQKTGNQKVHCAATAAVMILNRDRIGKAKLPSWWKE